MKQKKTQVVVCYLAVSIVKENYGTCYVVSTKLNDIPRLRDKFYDLTVTPNLFGLENLGTLKNITTVLQPTEEDYQSYDKYGYPIFDHNMMNDNYYTSGKQYQVKCSSVNSETRAKLLISI